MEKPTALINSSMLPQYRGQIVRIVGKVTKLTPTSLLLQTSDLGSVEVSLNRDTDLSGHDFVEVIGKVADGGEALREFTSSGLGESVDMNLVEKVVGLSKRFPELFEGGEGDE